MPMKGITSLNNMAIINVSGPGMKGLAARVFAVMSRAGISVMLITQSSSEYIISFCVPQHELRLARRALEDKFHLELKDGVLEPLDYDGEAGNYLGGWRWHTPLVQYLCAFLLRTGVR